MPPPLCLHIYLPRSTCTVSHVNYCAGFLQPSVSSPFQFISKSCVPEVHVMEIIILKTALGNSLAVQCHTSTQGALKSLVGELKILHALQNSQEKKKKKTEKKIFLNPKLQSPLVALQFNNTLFSLEFIILMIYCQFAIPTTPIYILIASITLKFWSTSFPIPLFWSSPFVL